MKALSLTQPWASLVACGAKRIETRSWSTAYRGPLAIHAAKAFPRDCRETAEFDFHFRRFLIEAGYVHRFGGIDVSTLERGAIVATCRVVRCARTELIVSQISDQERAFGDYSSGRWAWLLNDIVRLPEPITARGALGLWEWERKNEPTTHTAAGLARAGDTAGQTG